MYIRCISCYLTYEHPGRGGTFRLDLRGNQGTFRQPEQPTAHGGHGAAFTLARCRVGPQAPGETPSGQGAIPVTKQHFRVEVEIFLSAVHRRFIALRHLPPLSLNR